MRLSPRTRAYAAILGAMTIGTLFSPIFKTLLALNVGLNSANITFLRMLITCLVLWAYCLSVPALRLELRLIRRDRRILFMLLALGVLRGIDLLCWAYAIDGTTTFVVSILGNSTPLFVLVASFLLYREKPPAMALLGVLICLGGLCIVGATKGEGGANVKSIVLMILSALSYTCFLLISRKLRAGQTQVSAVLLMTLVFTVCVPTVLIPCLVSPAGFGPFPLNAWLLIIALVVCSTLVSQIVPIWAMKDLSASTVSMLSLAGPLLSAITCFLLLGEVPSPAVMIGGGVTLIGLFLYTLFTERRTPPQALAQEELPPQEP